MYTHLNTNTCTSRTHSIATQSSFLPAALFRGTLPDLTVVKTPVQVYVRLRPSSVKSVGMAADKMEEAIKATSDVELALEPPANARR